VTRRHERRANVLVSGTAREQLITRRTEVQILPLATIRYPCWTAPFDSLSELWLDDLWTMTTLVPGTGPGLGPELDRPSGEALDRPTDRHSLCCGVEGGPLESDEFAAPHSGVRGEM